MLDHLREIGRAFFMKKVQLAMDAIDTHIEALKKDDRPGMYWPIVMN